jgi:hypothetical protein
MFQVALAPPAYRVWARLSATSSQVAVPNEGETFSYTRTFTIDGVSRGRGLERQKQPQGTRTRRWYVGGPPTL